MVRCPRCGNLGELEEVRARAVKYESRLILDEFSKREAPDGSSRSAIFRASARISPPHPSSFVSAASPIFTV